MRTLISILIMASMSGTAFSGTAEISVTAFGFNISVLNPNPSQWHEKDRQYTSEDSKGLITLRREPIHDEKSGYNISPYLGLIYHRFKVVPPSAAEYARLKNDNLAYTVEVFKDRGSSVYCEGYYHSKGLIHRVFVLYTIENDVLIQLVADTTESVYKYVRQDIELFMTSLKYERRVEKLI